MLSFIKAKFTQNEHAKQGLLATGNKIIAEVTKDTLWGTGIPLANQRALDETTWAGRVWMNNMLICIRSELKGV